MSLSGFHINRRVTPPFPQRISTQRIREVCAVAMGLPLLTGLLGALLAAPLFRLTARDNWRSGLGGSSAMVEAHSAQWAVVLEGFSSFLGGVGAPRITQIWVFFEAPVADGRCCKRSQEDCCFLEGEEVRLGWIWVRGEQEWRAKSGWGWVALECWRRSSLDFRCAFPKFHHNPPPQAHFLLPEN